MATLRSRKTKDIAGQKFGYLVVINYEGLDKFNRAMWKCLCKCGEEATISGTSLRKGVTKSCGCLAKEHAYNMGFKHGMANSPEYRSWSGLKKRCTLKTDKDYLRYGGRGIKVCDRWQNFKNFYEDMGQKPTSKHSIDRIDNNGDYSPENCRWATAKEQMRNRISNTHITVEGKKMIFSEASEKYNICPQVVRWRINRGWGIDESFLVPVRKKRKNGTFS